jgi:hypothetical protein
MVALTAKKTLKKLKQNEVTMKRFLILFFLLSAFSLFMLSCASNWTKKNGSFVRDDDIKTMFETHEYVSDYNYFYTDSAYWDYPEAIVGIKKDYGLVKVSGWVSATNWQQFEPGSEKLKELVEAIYTRTSYGYIIYAPGGGDQIGVMYSQKWVGPYIPEIRFKDGDLIAVTPHKYNSTFAPP